MKVREEIQGNLFEFPEQPLRSLGRFFSPLRYAGGKTRAVKVILPLIPKWVRRVASPFMGGGSVEIAIANQLGLPVQAYDLFDLLVNYWQVQLSRPEELYFRLSSLEPADAEYCRVKETLKKHWNKHDGYDGGLPELEAAALYYFNMQLSYGPGFLGWMSSIYQERRKYELTLERVRGFRSPNLNVRHAPFWESIPHHCEDFLYCDPPYYLGGDSRMFRGIYPMRNFPVHHDGFDHEALAQLLKKHRGGFILSYNDCSWVRQTYREFEIREAQWQYSMGQGETRIGSNRLGRDYDQGNVKSSHELLIIGKCP